MTTMNTTLLIHEFKWVLKILDSSKSKEHMSTTLRCFRLWETKYVTNSLSTNELKLIKELRANFWSKFKNKIYKFGSVHI